MQYFLDRLDNLIDDLCQRDPDLMHRVAKRGVGNLDRWFASTAFGGVSTHLANAECGCLIGTIALEGVKRARIRNGVVLNSTYPRVALEAINHAAFPDESSIDEAMDVGQALGYRHHLRDYVNERICANINLIYGIE